MTSQPNRNGNGLPVWAKVVSLVGLPGFLLAYMLGAVPGLRSPISILQDAIDGNTRAIDRHEESTKVSQRIQRLTCQGIWRGNEAMQAECAR